MAQKSESGVNIRLMAIGWCFCALFFFYAFVLRVSPAVMVDELMREFSVGATILGNLSATYLYIYAGLQIPLGLLVDRFGLRGLVAGACAICGCGCLIFASADGVFTAYLGRAMVGAGAAFSFVGALNMAARWFPSRFAILGGWAQMMGSAGGVVGQGPLSLVVAMFGWRNANVGLGIAGLVLAILLVFTVRDPKTNSEGTVPSVWSGLKCVVINIQTWFATFATAGLTGTLLAFGGLWGVPYLMTMRGLDKPEAAILISLVFIGWAAGAPFFGWLSDRIKNRRILLILGTGGATVTTAILVIIPWIPTFFLGTVLVLQGALSSSMILGFALVKESNPNEAGGVALGFINTFVVGSGAVLQPIIGMLLDARWNGLLLDGVRQYGAEDYQVSLIILPFVCLLSFISAIIIKER